MEFDANKYLDLYYSVLSESKKDKETEFVYYIEMAEVLKLILTGGDYTFLSDRMDKKGFDSDDIRNHRFTTRISDAGYILFEVPEEFNKHPHVYDSKRKEKDTDTIYIAKDVCTFDNNIKGYGIFKYDEKLDLTKKGMNRTCWDLPDFFKGVKIAYHNENSFKEGYFKSACRGQEFVIEDNKDVEEWAINLIKEHSTNRIKCSED